jgi:hypothetical protein
MSAAAVTSTTPGPSRRQACQCEWLWVPWEWLAPVPELDEPEPLPDEPEPLPDDPDDSDLAGGDGLVSDEVLELDDDSDEEEDDSDGPDDEGVVEELLPRLSVL